MSMCQYIKAIKIKLWKQYHFKPSKMEGDEPCFDNIPDGDYPMVIAGKLDKVRIVKGHIHCHP